jgi:hypothetical protein
MFYSRGKNKVRNPYTLQDMYKEYIKDKEEGSPYHIEYKSFVLICTEFYKGISKHILNGGIYFMPHRLGNISVIKKRPKKMTKFSLSPDWSNTQKFGKLIPHTNDHSDYYKFRFHWSKTDCYVSNKGKYRMVFTRENKRELAKKIKSGDYEYFEL